MDFEILPGRDSPKHILNALNDDCIQSVLRRVNNIRDFLSAAETCVRFQENAKLTFRTHYKTIRIGKLCNYALYDRHTVTDRVHSFLSIFGHLITELDFDDKFDENIAKMIANYCGRTLRTFKFGDKRSEHYSSINFSTLSPLQALEELEIRHINILKFEYHSQLRRLSVEGIYGNRPNLKFDWLIQTFPQLECLELRELHQLQYKQAMKFFRLNPQLKSLVIYYCKHIQPKVFRKMADFTPNLEKLVFSLTSHPSRAQKEPLIHISKLRNLKSLAIIADSVPKIKLIDSLIENNVPIENLSFLIFYGAEASELSISRLKLLKKLFIRRVTDETLIDYVKSLPRLEEIMCYAEKITLKGIETALQYGKYLSVLVVDMYLSEITINSDDYESILNLAKSRCVKVTIYTKYGTIDVPTDLLEVNRKWLNVKIGVLNGDTIMRHFNE